MITVHQQIIIRVPAGFGSSAPDAGTLVEWRESHGPHCLSAARIVGATFPSSDSVDFVLADNSRVRARLDRHCPALDFYRILYVPRDRRRPDLRRPRRGPLALGGLVRNRRVP